MIEKKYKLVVVVPSGRQRYMELLIPQIMRQRYFHESPTLPLIDELRLWVNTKEQSDLDYLHELWRQYPNFITMEYCPKDETRIGMGWAIHHFYPKAADPQTVYIRLDDDVVWMEDDFLEKIYKFRVENPQYFLVYGNIVNNAVCDHLHQQRGVYPPEPVFGRACLDPNGWERPHMAEGKHRTLLSNIEEGNLDLYKFEPEVLHTFERVSINCISWLGAEFKKFDGGVQVDEEDWLSVVKPRDLGMPNCILGEALCAHFAFFTQRAAMDQTDVLELYRALVSEDQ